MPLQWGPVYHHEASMSNPWIPNTSKSIGRTSPHPSRDNSLWCWCAPAVKLLQHSHAFSSDHDLESPRFDEPYLSIARSMIRTRVEKWHGYDGCISEKKLASWGKKFGRTKKIAKTSQFCCTKKRDSMDKLPWIDSLSTFIHHKKPHKFCFVGLKCQKCRDLRAFLGVKSGLLILVRVKDLTFSNSDRQ